MRIKSQEKIDEEKLEKILSENLYDRDWCALNKIDYDYPEKDLEKAKRLTYQQFFSYIRKDIQ